MAADEPEGDSRLNVSRRSLIGGMIAVGSVPHELFAGTASPTTDEVDRLLTERISKVVVIYAENRSFNNLFGNFPGLQKPLSALTPEDYRQRDRDGSVLERLPPIWGGLVPKAQFVQHREYRIGEADLAPLANAPFPLRTAEGDPLPLGLITRDLIHSFYNHQHQINGGRNDGFVAWGDSGALVMGRYADTSVNLRLYRLAQEFTLCDNFFMGAFGGSFLNHQYLIAARPAYYPDADKGPAADRIAILDGDPKGIGLRQKPTSPRSALDGPVDFLPSQLTPDFHAVNTMGPPFSPAFSRDRLRPDFADPADARTVPPQSHLTIGDLLNRKGVDWAWYSGGWQLAIDGHGLGEGFPAQPNFQPHHQPFNYFAQFGPGSTERSRRLRDAGTGDSARTNKFLAAIEQDALPTVSFYKPQGDLNMHAGDSDVESADRHIATIVDALRNSRDWEKMLIVVTFDENGGWWDHVAPPKGDRWGPGTRIPAIIISPHAQRATVDHSLYDTGSIARFLSRRFGLPKLPGLILREAAMIRAGGNAPGDLTGALVFG